MDAQNQIKRPLGIFCGLHKSIDNNQGKKLGPISNYASYKMAYKKTKVFTLKNFLHKKGIGLPMNYDNYTSILLCK